MLNVVEIYLIDLYLHNFHLGPCPSQLRVFDWTVKMPGQQFVQKGSINRAKDKHMYLALLILVLGPDTLRIMSLSS